MSNQRGYLMRDDNRQTAQRAEQTIEAEPVARRFRLDARRHSHQPCDPEGDGQRRCRRTYLGRRTSESGQATLEFLFVVPFVFLLLFFVVEGANVTKRWMIIESAAREGARCGAVNKTAAQIQTCAVNDSCTGANGTPPCLLTSGNVTVTFPTVAPSGKSVKVAVSYTYSFAPAGSALGGFLSALRAPGLASITMSAHTQMRLESQSS